MTIINMGVQEEQTGLFSNRLTGQKINNDQKDTKDANQKSNTFFMGNMNHNISKVEQTKQSFKKQAAKIINDQRKKEMEFGDSLQDIEDKKSKLEMEYKEYDKAYAKATSDRKTMMDEVGMTEDSDSYKNVQLIKKAIKAKNGCGELSEEEQAKYNEIISESGIEESIAFKEIDQEILANKKENTYNQITGINEMVMGMKLEKLKTHAMEDAERAGKQIIDAGNKQVIGVAVQEAVEKAEERQEETEEIIQENQEKKVEEKKEEQEKKAQQANKTQNIKTQDTTNEETTVEMQQVQNLEQPDEVQQKIKQLAKQNVILPDELGGIVVDELI